MKNLTSKSILTLILILIIFPVFSQGVKISTTGGNPDGSAILEIESTNRGLLIPRMTTAQRTSIVTPAQGLLVFDSSLGSFFIYGKNYEGKTGWIDLSSDAGLWTKNASSVYLTNSTYNIGVGTDSPTGKFVVQANNELTETDILFEVKDKFGKTIFEVTSAGVKAYVKDPVKGAKGISGGFAVGKYGAAKGLGELFVVTSDSTRVYTDAGAGISGGFAVGKYGAAKGQAFKYFFTHSDSTRIYTDTGAKGISGGFAVGKYGAAKGPADNYMHMTRNNYLIGHSSGKSITTGLYNLFCGFESGISDTSGRNNSFFGYRTGYNNLSGNNNTFLGDSSGFGNTTGSSNLFAGKNSGISNTTGGFNTFLGYESGFSNTTGINNTFIGSQSGQLAISGNYNVFNGFNAGRNHNSGDNNVYIGYEAGSGGLSGNEDGINNVFVGTESGTNNTSGIYNTFLGYRTGFNNTSGGHNIFLGYQSGLNNSSGWTNIFIGSWAGMGNQTGSDNVYIGGTSGANNTHGLRNTYLGFYSGATATGTDNVFIGYEAGRLEAGSNKLFVSNTATTTPLIYGDFSSNYLRIHGSLSVGENPLVAKTSSKFRVFADNYRAYNGFAWYGGYAGTFSNDGNNVNRRGIELRVGTDDGSGTNYQIVFYDGNGTYQGAITSSGGIVSYGAKSANNNNKTIKNFNKNAITIINKIDVIEFKPSKESGKIITGFLGKDLLKLIPESTFYDEENDEYITDKSALVPILTKAIQEQNQKIEYLEKQIKELRELIKKK